LYINDRSLLEVGGGHAPRLHHGGHGRSEVKLCAGRIQAVNRRC
jgi:hypothetical protein